MSEKSGRARKVVSDASKLPQSSDPKEILKQVEFYFSDENLPTDKFLYQITEKNNGWVPIDTIHKFQRMRRFQPFEAVVEALKQSEDMLEVSEDNQSVRRRHPLQEPKPEAKKDAFNRTVYAKGFGEETETSQFDLESFFEQFGTTKQVRLRRADDGAFKSSVFVEFADAEQAKKFLELDPKPKYKDQELLTMSKQAYVEMKAAEHGFTANANGKRRKFNAFKNKPSRGPHGNKRRNDRNAENAAKRAKSESGVSAEPEDQKSSDPVESEKVAASGNESANAAATAATAATEN